MSLDSHLRPYFATHTSRSCGTVLCFGHTRDTEIESCNSLRLPRSVPDIRVKQRV
jgi:hypothetical protein